MTEAQFKKILGQLQVKIKEHWSDVTFTEKDTTHFRFPKDNSYCFEHNVKAKGMDWYFDIDYNKSDENGKILKVADRSIAIYYRVTKKNGDKVDRTLHVFRSDSSLTLYDQIIMFQVRVNSNLVANFHRRTDLTKNGELLDEAGKKLYDLIFRP
tara:strand:+ start:338 stop:799 length:462 start_codon:yes stop_codon:yes gene_type:complete